MASKRAAIGYTESGEKIEALNLRQADPTQVGRYARKLTEIGKEAYAQGEHYDLGAPLYGLRRARDTRWQMKAARRINGAVNLLFINDDLVGVKAVSIERPSNTPIVIARPTRPSMRVSYWLAPPYRRDESANVAVANTLVKADSLWQWDYVDPDWDPDKREAYSRLGMTAVVADTTQGIYTIDGTGIHGVELWAKQPTEDSAELGDVMLNLDALVRQTHIHANAER